LKHSVICDKLELTLRDTVFETQCNVAPTNLGPHISLLKIVNSQ